MALSSTNDENHLHLTSLNIGNESSEEGESASDIDSRSPLHNNHNMNNDERHVVAFPKPNSSRRQQHSGILLPSRTDPYAPTPPSSLHHHSTSHTNNKKLTNLPLLTACYLSALTTGATTYAFSFYSSALKSSLHLSQNQLDTLSSATFCAGVLSWMPGMIVDAWGARSAMALGGTSNAINLSLYWMLATERWKLHDLDLLILVLSALGVLIFVGCALVTGSVFKVIVESCGPGTKGKAVGCAKGYVGVGSGVYVCLFGALFGTKGGGGGAGVGPAALLAASPFNSLSSLMSTSSTSTVASDVPANPELSSLNFLVMAAVLSFLAATLPALLLLPKQPKQGANASSTEEHPSVYQSRRDGTRSIHFRVIYAGLVLLGVWVVGMSLMELEQQENEEEASHGDDSTNGNGGDDNSDVSPTILNNTLWSDEFLEEDHATTIPYSTYARRILQNVSRSLSSSSTQTHWGSVFFILMLWWGPALSLLVIPPRKEGAEEESIIYTQENLDGSFNYDDDDSDDENDDDERPSNQERGEDEEEETFLQDDLPMSNNNNAGLSSLSIKNGDRASVGGDALASIERNFTLTQMLRTCPAWLMAWTCVILVGGGTVMTNNIGQMTESLGFDPATTSASLALFSAAQGASRVCTGIASELALKWELPWYCGCLFGSGGNGNRGGTVGVPRPAFLVLASLVSAASHFLLAVSTSEEVFAFGVTLSGVAFGMVWPMMVLITGEVFGTPHVGANYMFFDGFSSAAGTLLLSKFVAQEVYDEHIMESHGDPGAAATAPIDDGTDFKCLGTGCFAMSHVIVSLLSLTCVVSSIGLIRSTRDVYERP